MSTPANQRPRMFVLNDPHAMRISPDLASEIGLNESIVLLQIEFLMRGNTEERDGKRWIYHPLEYWQREHFSWWSVATIARIFKNLEKAELIYINSKYNRAGYDRTQWVALNYEGLRNLTSIHVSDDMDAISQNEKAISQFEKSILQDETSISQIDTPILQSETTIQKTKNKTNREERESASPARTPAVQAYFQTFNGQSLNAPQVEAINRTVTDLPRWQKVLDEWMLNGWGPRSIGKMLDRYTSGLTMADQRPSGSSSKPAERPAPTTYAPPSRSIPASELATPEDIARVMRAGRPSVRRPGEA